MPCRARPDDWQRALTLRGLAVLMAAPVALMVAIGWAIGLGVHDPAWLALQAIPFALTAVNLGLDDVIKRGRRELRRSLGLSAARIRELARTAEDEIKKAYQVVIYMIADRVAAQPSHDRAAEHLPPPRPRLVALTLSPRLLPIPRARAVHDQGIGRA
jgi:hypothetical protein